MRALIVIASRDSDNSGRNASGLPFSVLENLNQGIEITNNSPFCSVNILLTGWGLVYPGYFTTIHTAMTRWIRQFAPYGVSKVVEAFHPSSDCGETDDEYVEWEAETIMLTAGRIQADKVIVVCYGPNERYQLQLTQGIEDFKFNHYWARSLEVEYIPTILEVCL